MTEHREAPQLNELSIQTCIACGENVTWDKTPEPMHTECALQRECEQLRTSARADAAELARLRIEVTAWREAAEQEARDSVFPGNPIDEPNQIELAVARMKAIVAERLAIAQNPLRQAVEQARSGPALRERKGFA